MTTVNSSAHTVPPPAAAPQGADCAGQAPPAATAAELRFLQWLRENGATWDKLEWPSYATASGSRGVVATADIAPGEPFLCIPERCMLTPPQAQRLPCVGRVFAAEAEGLLRGDAALALYVMHEWLRGDASFFAPYLAVLPAPHTAEDWDATAVAALQDERLAANADARSRQLTRAWERTISALAASYPGMFPREKYTLQLWRRAWGVIRARAFGRRLPWSALVPLADCLNHGNVPTKYDFDAGGNGVFRLWPSGSGGGVAVPHGCEALNSYGRRSNAHLLLEYGFAMLDNEWDEVAVPLSNAAFGECSEECSARRRAVWCVLGMFPPRSVQIKRDAWPQALLQHCRVASLTAPQCAALCARPPPPGRFPAAPLSVEAEAAALRAAAALLSAHLIAYPTALAADEELLRRCCGSGGGGGGGGGGSNSSGAGGSCAGSVAPGRDAARSSSSSSGGSSGSAQLPLPSGDEYQALVYRVTAKRIVAAQAERMSTAAALATAAAVAAAAAAAAAGDAALAGDAQNGLGAVLTGCCDGADAENWVPSSYMDDVWRLALAAALRGGGSGGGSGGGGGGSCALAASALLQDIEGCGRAAGGRCCSGGSSSSSSGGSANWSLSADAKEDGQIRAG